MTCFWLSSKIFINHLQKSLRDTKVKQDLCTNMVVVQNKSNIYTYIYIYQKTSYFEKICWNSIVIHCHLKHIQFSNAWVITSCLSNPMATIASRSRKYHSKKPETIKNQNILFDIHGLSQSARRFCLSCAKFGGPLSAFPR